MFAVRPWNVCWKMKIIELHIIPYRQAKFIREITFSGKFIWRKIHCPEKECQQHTNSIPLYCHGKCNKILKENGWHGKFLHWLCKYYKFSMVLSSNTTSIAKAKHISHLTLISYFYFKICVKYKFYFIYNNVSQTIWWHLSNMKMRKL